MSPIAALSVLLCLAVTAAKPIVCPVAVKAATSTICPNLGTAANYVVVAYAGMTSTGLSVIKGNVAVAPIPSVTGAPTITGTILLNTPAAVQAVKDQTAAYKYLEGLTPTKDLTGIDLAGETLTPGVYDFASTAGISVGGTLTLSGAGVYVFQVGSAITTAADTEIELTSANTKIALTKGAKAGCVFWQVGSSVTLGATSTFVGSIFAYASVTFGAGVTYAGSVYAQTGDVTLIDDAITQQAACSC